MRVAIVGYGVEGKSAAKYWRARGADITICDQNATLETDGFRAQLGDGYLQDLDRFNLIVRTAGMNPEIILRSNPNVGPKMTTLMNEFLRVCPTKNVIGITGTKGKGTTTTLVTRMLKAAGKEVFWGGNIGVPPFDFLRDLTPESWVILELSSFQLYDVRHSPHIGVCLMVVPEHLNWHRDMGDYLQAKAQLFKHQTRRDIAIYFADNELSHQIASQSPGKKIPYFASPGAYVQDGFITIDDQQICHVDEVKLLGEFNWQNACAAVTAVWQVIKDTNAIKAVLTTFSGLPHRLELIREVGGVGYYDDSFGTTPETAIAAIEAFKRPKVLILGGSDKGVSFKGLAHAIASDETVRHVVLIGETASAIEEALRAEGFENFSLGGAAMRVIVKAAQAQASKGDVVLLSPGCASFGLFKNYKDRGEQFKLAVGAL